MKMAQKTNKISRALGVTRPMLTKGEKRKLTFLRNTLLAWFSERDVSFPWRRPEATVYERVVVEVLLQRTRRETVAAIYEQFFARFPTWTSIASCTEEELQEILKPLGLWRRRAASLKALSEYADKRHGRFPSSEKALEGVPAVGQYVGNAILLFQHGQARPLVDVNMARVIERNLRQRGLADIRHDPWLQACAAWLVRFEPIDTNWAVLDFAAIVCTARKPKCPQCPLKTRCAYPKKSSS